MTNAWQVLALIWIISGLFELAASQWPSRSPGQFSSYWALAFSAGSAGVLLALGINLLSVLFLILAIYRAANLARILAGRLEVHHLRSVSLRSCLALLASQLSILVMSCYWPAKFTSGRWLTVLALSQLWVAAYFALNFFRQLTATRYVHSEGHLSQKELPTLTVAIPAKNETADLENCLNSLLASDYQKLEILVLDDSAGSKTGEIIRGLAHDGVRFILGDPPKGRWLAKNYAYQRLSDEANGEIILFCGVDARFAPDTLKRLVEKLVLGDRECLSVMPFNVQDPKSLLIQPMRYFWELARPRFGSSPPVLSTCWLIRREQLQAVGGFRAVANGVVPERYFARQSAQRGKYAFIRSNRKLGITSIKSNIEQRNTAIRTRYPLLHKSLAEVAGTSLFTLFWLVGPFALVFIIPFFDFNIYIESAAVLACLLWLIVYGKILRVGFSASWLAALLFVPASLMDVILANKSLLKYEFGRVLWKGRDVAHPVMDSPRA